MSVIVLTPPTARNLTTVERARRLLHLASADDDAASMAIGQASAAAASYCRRTFGRQTVRQRFDLQCKWPPREAGLLLDLDPIVSIVAVTVDGAPLADGDYEVEDRTLYRLSGGHRSWWGGRGVAVDYITGWTLPTDQNAGDLPADIERAVIRLVGFAVSSSSRDPTVKSEDVTGVGSVSYYVTGANASLADPEAEALLRPYRRLLFA